MSQRGQRADPSHLKYRPVPGSKLREVYIPCDRSYWQWQYCGDITEAGYFRPWLWPECQCWEAVQLCGAPLEPDWHEQWLRAFGKPPRRDIINIRIKLDDRERLRRMVLEVLGVWVFEDQNEMEAVVQVAPTVTVKQIETSLTCRHINVVPSRILCDRGLRFTER